MQVWVDRWVEQRRSSPAWRSVNSRTVVEKDEERNLSQGRARCLVLLLRWKSCMPRNNPLSTFSFSSNSCTCYGMLRFLSMD